jgi:hypothetical protein
MPLPLAAWESFYVIVGSSAAALTGLQFVVIALIAESGRQSTHREIAAFGTPTVVHFCSALLVAAILSAPWDSLSSTAVALGASGMAGVVYAWVVVKRARRQKGYKPVLEDWMWHTVLPAVAYVALVASAVLLTRRTNGALFVVGAATLLLLFIGIHNAWDTVVYITVERSKPRERKDPSNRR